MLKPLPGPKTGNKGLILAIWSLKTRDYRFFDDFYPAKQLSAACSNRSLELRFLFPHDVPSYLDTHAKSLDIKATVCLIRGPLEPVIFELLEKKALRCINTRASMDVVQDKYRLYQFLTAHNWPTIKTDRIDPDTPLISSEYSFPVVIKPRYGSRGRGVSLIASETSLRAAITYNANEQLLLQEYLANSHGRDVRILLAGDTLVAAYERVSAQGNFKSNACEGAIAHKASWDGIDYWIQMARDICARAGLWYASVDFLFRSPPSQKMVELAVCEVNASPGFEALDRDLCMDSATILIDAMIQDFFS